MDIQKVYLLTGTIYDSMCDSTHGIVEHIFADLANAYAYLRKNWLDVEDHNVLKVEELSPTATRFMISIPSDAPEWTQNDLAVLVFSERTLE